MMYRGGTLPDLSPGCDRFPEIVTIFHDGDNHTDNLIRGGFPVAGMPTFGEGGAPI